MAVPRQDGTIAARLKAVEDELKRNPIRDVTIVDAQGAASAAAAQAAAASAAAAAADAAAAAASAAAAVANAAKLDLLVALNASPLTIGGGLITLDTISVAVAATGVANTVFGLELDATATGTGTVTITFYFGSTQVGPTVQEMFTAGPLHVCVNDFLIGLSTSANFMAKAQVTTGAGTIAVPADGANMHLIGTNLEGGGSSTSPSVSVSEIISYDSSVTDAVDTSLLTPLAVTPTEAVDTTPSTTTETVTAVTTP